MKRVKHIFFYAFLALALCLGIERTYYHFTDGFSIGRIETNLPFNPAFELEPHTHDLEALKEALSQPYHYLGKGSQSFAFESEDQRYIIKFFKYYRWRLKPFIKKIPLPPPLNAYRAKRIRKKREAIESTLNSSKVSFTEFKDETALIYTHLNKTHHLNCTLHFTDPLNRKRSINLDDYHFVVQKKAEMTYTRLQKLKKQGKLTEAKNAISSLLSLTIKRSEKGYSDKDPHLIRNFGFIGGFIRDPKKDRAYFYSFELIRIKRKLLNWVDKNYPELSLFVCEEIAKLIKEGNAQCTTNTSVSL